MSICPEDCKNRKQGCIFSCKEYKVKREKYYQNYIEIGNEMEKYRRSETKIWNGVLVSVKRVSEIWICDQCPEKDNCLSGEVCLIMTDRGTPLTAKGRLSAEKKIEKIKKERHNG